MRLRDRFKNTKNPQETQEKEQGGTEEMALVTKDTMIGELLMMNSSEEIQRILLGLGMHCLGCPASQMETIEEAAMVHGENPQDVVDQINSVLA